MDDPKPLNRRAIFEIAGKSAMMTLLAGTSAKGLAEAAANPEPADGLAHAWVRFSQLIGDFAQQFDSLGAPPHGIDRAEGFRLLLRYLTIGIDQYIEYADPAFPAFYQKTRDGVRKFAGDSPEQLYDSATISGEYDYLVSGNMREVEMLEFTIYSGTLNSDNKVQRRLTDSLTERELKIDRNGDFTIRLGKDRQPGNSLLLDTDSSVIVARRYLRDPINDKPRPLVIKRISGTALQQPLNSEKLSKALIQAVSFASWNVRTWAEWVKHIRKNKFNRLVHFDDTGDIFTPAGHHYLDGYWSVPPGHALLVSFVPPQGKYWSFVPMNFWMESFEWRFGNRVFASSYDTRPDNDGRITLALAAVDPQLPNTQWLETMGHAEGPMALRLARYDGAMPPVDCRLVKLSGTQAL